MDENKIISEWRGECRHPNEEEYAADNRAAMHRCPNCRLSWHWSESPDFAAPDYTTDPAAWDDKLFGEIEAKGLWQKFMDECIRITTMAKYPNAVESQQDHVTATFKMYWRAFKATPKQKASALARSIKEAG